MSAEDYEMLADQYREEWSKNEAIILSAMQNIIGLKFYCPVIDITAAADIIPKSEPLLISFRNRPSTVVDTITHELCHALLCDNKTVSIYGKDRGFSFVDVWSALFDINDDSSMVVHVPVFAICKKVFEDHLGDKDYVSRDKKLMKKFGATSYLKAWKYVDEVGHEEIINKLKKSYAEIESNKRKL